MVDSKIFFYISKNLYVTKDTAGTFIITAILFYLFFILGFMISKGLDYIFTEFDEDEEEKITFFELFLEMAFAYWFYFVLDKYVVYLTEPIFKIFGKSISAAESVKNYLVIGFYFGLFYELKKLAEKRNYFFAKYLHI